MSLHGQKQYLTCPFCRFGSHDFDTLERHVQHVHADQQGVSNRVPQPDTRQKPQRTESGLSDFELAQLLAFEEAGLPAELALPERPNVPARHGNQRLASATQNGRKTSTTLAKNEEPWVQCVCGERVHFLELDAHSDMHAQENISIDEPEMPVKDVDLSTLRSTAQQPLADTSNFFSTDIPKSLRNYDQIHPSRTPPSNDKRRGPSLKDIFLGTPASPKRKSAYSAVSSKYGKTKRLGVCPSWLTNGRMRS